MWLFSSPCPSSRRLPCAFVSSQLLFGGFCFLTVLSNCPWLGSPFYEIYIGTNSGRKRPEKVNTRCAGRFGTWQATQARDRCKKDVLKSTPDPTKQLHISSFLTLSLRREHFIATFKRIRTTDEIVTSTTVIVNQPNWCSWCRYLGA